MYKEDKYLLNTLYYRGEKFFVFFVLRVYYIRRENIIDKYCIV